MANWEVRFSKSRSRPYFYNTDTQESRWEPPEGMTDDAIASLPGADVLTNPPPAAAAGGSGGPTKVQASHILVKHKDSRRPSSWKEPKITRSKSEAIEILRGHEDSLKALPSDQRSKRFGDIAKTESDCSSHSNNGDLGAFGRGQMQKPFEDAAFGLQPGEMSSIIETESGVHLVLRTA